MKHKYLTTPVASSNLPGGIPYIVGNEAAERFSFYGMKAILAVFMTQYLLGADGELDVMSNEDAKAYVALFTAGAYFFPTLGSIISDGLFGKYYTILSLSLFYCLGHLVLALDETRSGLLLGLTLIAIGAGGIKPCVSAHVGDQFGVQNQHLLSKVFSWFYFSINLGAFASMMLTPVLLDQFGPQVAFGVPGVLMAIATVVFWMGRHKFVHVPAGGVGFLREAFSGEGLKVLGKLAVIYSFVAMFWCLFDQTGGAWVLQAEQMDRNWLGVEWLSSQIQAVNSILILIFIPLFSYLVYPAINSFFPLTPLRKISIGLFLVVVPFIICALVETQITKGGAPNIVWQILAYAMLTAAEVMVSITGLEFSYTQAPKKMKSLVMSFWFLSVTGGNLVTFFVNKFIQNEDGSNKLAGASYYWFFAGLMLLTAILFIPVARMYRGRTYIQGAD